MVKFEKRLSKSINKLSKIKYKDKKQGVELMKKILTLIETNGDNFTFINIGLKNLGIKSGRYSFLNINCDNSNLFLDFLCEENKVSIPFPLFLAGFSTGIFRFENEPIYVVYVDNKIYF